MTAAAGGAAGRMHAAADYGPQGRPTIDCILPSIAAALGVGSFENALGLPEAARYIMFVVDGMGAHLLRDNPQSAPFLSSLSGVDGLVCGVPSTTATSLTSLSTGLRPGQHGMAGYTCRVPETGQRMNLLTWDQPVVPELWQPHRSLLAQLGDAGVDADVVNEAKFEDSGLTRCTHRDVRYHGVKSTWERLDVVLDVVEQSSRGLVYAYDSRLDHSGHLDGCASEAWHETLLSIDADVAQLHDELPGDTVLLVTADHGMIDLPEEGRFDLDTVPGLRDGVELVAGEARLRHLYVRPGATEDVLAGWREVMGDRAIVERREDLVDWFGPMAPDVRDRFGDVIVASLGEFAVFSSVDFSLEFMLRGFHGSVTEAELAIPVLISAG